MRHRAHAAAASLFASALIAGTAASAQAAPLPETSGTQAASSRALAASSAAARDPVSQPAATAAAQQRRVRDYWTAERMRQAKPASTLVDGPSAREGDGKRPPIARGKPTAVPPAGDTSAADPQPRQAESGAPWEGGGKVTATTGKVFFTLGGSDYVCSGSAVNGANKDTVLTAGHCVNEGPGAFATNWTFVPGYDHGDQPHGEWTARTLVTTEQWKSDGNINYDAGFAVMNARGGEHLVNAVGGQGIAFNKPRGQPMYSFGYPAAQPYGGQDLIYCSGQVTDDTTGNTSSQGMSCDMTGGSSGGPWSLNFDPNTGTGLLNSVNSFRYESDPGTMYGPYFGAAIQQAYERAANA